MSNSKRIAKTQRKIELLEAERNLNLDMLEDIQDDLEIIESQLDKLCNKMIKLRKEE